jgi:hypothetical protein
VDELTASDLILRTSVRRSNGADDYDVLSDGEVVGRISPASSTLAVPCGIAVGHYLPLVLRAPPPRTLLVRMLTGLEISSRSENDNCKSTYGEADEHSSTFGA